jgi:hypothetical protein
MGINPVFVLALGVFIAIFAFCLAPQVHKQDHFVPIALWGLAMFLIGLIAGVLI